MSATSHVSGALHGDSAVAPHASVNMFWTFCARLETTGQR
ncbi:hypothetical protein ALQ78_101621 [Pseudomonas syringae pv. aptata]|nr:Unknown protein sequence [Pseudomonas syringae pv. syringae]RMM40801.1 hypothetical protein ALQ78_101621 [Pseudomonas syringae pv. aptata]RMS24371.1 hypothetical protein ALP69_102098 [Pseudomonas syringae pv. aceris]